MTNYYNIGVIRVVGFRVWVYARGSCGGFRWSFYNAQLYDVLTSALVQVPVGAWQSSLSANCDALPAMAS